MEHASGDEDETLSQFAGMKSSDWRERDLKQRYDKRNRFRFYNPAVLSQ